MKRFYKLVTASSCPGGYAIELDGRPVKTPSGMALVAPAKNLADALVLEWAGQEKDIVPDSMPLTQILTTLQDQVRTQRQEMSGRVLAYLDTDLLCYRAEQPQALAQKQADAWDPWLGWFAQKYGVALQITTGLAALKQPEAAHEAAEKAVAAMDEAAFTALQLVTPLAGSLILALAFVDGAASPVAVFAAAYVEEDYKARIYNEAVHGAAPLQEQKQAAMRRDLGAARKFLDLLKK